MISSTINYLVTGANRGIGLAFIEQLAQRDNTLIFATSRNPTSSKELQSLAEKHKNIHLLKLESTSEEDAKAAFTEISKFTDHLDVIIANAGLGKSWESVLKTPLSEFRDHFEVNLMGNVILFQTFYPLLKKNKGSKFVVVSSVGGSISKMTPTPTIAYGTSKAAVNYLTKKISLEHSEEGIIAFVTHPGLVATDMGTDFLEHIKRDRKPISPEESAIAQLKLIDAATLEYSGRFWNYNGEELPY